MNKPLKLGIKVRTREGAAGQVSKIITDPSTHQPTYLVVTRGHLRPQQVVVPVSLVGDVTLDAVNLDIDNDTMAHLPDYEITVRRGEFQKPLAVPDVSPATGYTPPKNRASMVLRQRSVPEGSTAVEKGMTVRDSEGHSVGKVEGIVLDPERRKGKYIVMRRDSPLSYLQVLPAELVADVRENQVHLHITAEHVVGLAAYQPMPV